MIKGGFFILIIMNILASIGLIIAALIVLRIVQLIVRLLTSNRFAWQQKIYSNFGIKANKPVVEFIVLHALFYIIIWMIAFLFFMKIWGLSESYLKDIYTGILQGFKIGNLHITPTRILLALLIFIILGLFNRWLKVYITRHSALYTGDDTQITVATLIGYLGYTIITIIALAIAGVNFTALAIIAGTLSIGIGFGLQNIISNFVSGIILLTEKPIRPGDRIIIGDMDGFVKKIRIRSTQIQTLTKADIIVPNSELISKQITNYMFRDSAWRVTCKVGVRYGSDIELVKKVLLEVADLHPNVEKMKPNQPIVLFREFAESNLIFDLWCVINDVNKKYIIQSDLNFAIDAAFRQHNIIIAFPQRDIHVKEFASQNEK